MYIYPYICDDDNIKGLVYIQCIIIIIYKIENESKLTDSTRSLPTNCVIEQYGWQHSPIE